MEVLELRSLSAHMGNHIKWQMPPRSCVYLCVVQATVIPLSPSTTSPPAARSLSHKSLKGECRKLPHITTPVSDGSTTTMTSSSLTYAAVESDRQANTEEHQRIPDTETKYCRGESSSSLDTLTRHSRNKILCGFMISSVSGSSSSRTVLLIDDTISRPHFHSYSSTSVILFLFSAYSYPPPTSPPLSHPPTSLPISYLQVFSSVT